MARDLPIPEPTTLADSTVIVLNADGTIATFASAADGSALAAAFGSPSDAPYTDPTGAADRTVQSVVALLGLTILSVPASVGVQWVHLKAEAP